MNIDKIDMTTIAVSKKNNAKIQTLKRGGSADDVVSRLLNSQADVYTEFILIDNDLPQLHTCVFQLGDDVASLFLWNGVTIEPVSLDQANKLMKQPKPCFSMPLEDVKRVVSILEDPPDEVVWIDEYISQIGAKMAKFVEAHEQ